MDVQWIIATVAIFLAGAGLGFLLGFVLRKGDNAKLADAEAELEAYKREVTEHFGQSAEHFQAIGSHYRKLYEHMAVGSEKLCNPVEADNNLKFPPPAEVAIEAPLAESTASEKTVEDEPTEDKAPNDYAENDTPDESPPPDSDSDSDGHGDEEEKVAKDKNPA